MGMAASQARYLGLTARKTNCEYEGQQVNQQRTALANQSANLFNQLLALEVPTPPSTSDYTTIQYSYNDGTNNEIISEYTPLGTTDPLYNYNITHYHTADVYTGVETKTVNPQVKKDTAGDFSYVGNSPLTKANSAKQQSLTTPNVVYDSGTSTYTSVNGNALSAYSETTDSAALSQFKTLYPNSNIANAATTDVMKYVDSSGVTHFVCESDLDTAYNSGGVQNPLSNYVSGDTTTTSAISQILKDLPDSQFAKDFAADPTSIYTFKSGGVTYYACNTDLTTSYNSKGGEIDNQATLNKYNATDLSKKIYTTEKASIEVDGSGRFTNIKTENSSAVYDVKTSTTTDENAYNDAMNQYNYDMASYEKQVQDINAKTSIIQEEDRTLELRLKQLDTEQEALQTEMDAVKKVIDKNIEQTFKTFA